MVEKTLEKLGLSPNEAKIYNALLDLKEASVGQITKNSNIHRRNVYDTINRLIDKGLIFPIVTKGGNHYAAVDPDKLSELLQEREISLARALPNLKIRFERKQSRQEAYIYRGIAGMKRYIRDILRVGKDTYTIGAQLCWLDPKLKAFSLQAMKEFKRRGIKFYYVLGAGIKDKAKRDLNKFGSNYRVLPQKYCSDSTIDVFGDYVVTFTGVKFKKVTPDATIFVLHDQNLANSYRTWFQFIFDHCKK